VRLHSGDLSLIIIVREVRGVGGWVPWSLDNSVLGSWNQRPGLRPAKLVVLLVLLLTCSSNHLDGDCMVHRETRGLPMVSVIVLMVSPPWGQSWRLAALSLLTINQVPGLLVEAS